MNSFSFNFSQTQKIIFVYYNNLIFEFPNFPNYENKRYIFSIHVDGFYVGHPPYF